MKPIVLLLFCVASLSAQNAPDTQYEDNWRIAADALQRQIADECRELLPAVGLSLDDVIAKYGKPRETYLQNSFKLRVLEFNFDIKGEDRGLSTVFPVTMRVVFIDDKVTERAFPSTDIGPRKHLISDNGLSEEHPTQQTRYNMLLRAKEFVTRTRSEFIRRKIIPDTNTPNQAVDSTATRVTPPAEQETRHGQP